MRSATFLKTHCPYVSPPLHGFSFSATKNSFVSVTPCKFEPFLFNLQAKPARFLVLCYRDSEKSALEQQSVGVEDSNGALTVENTEQNQWSVEVGSPSFGFWPLAKLSLSDKAFLLFTFIALTVNLTIASNFKHLLCAVWVSPNLWLLLTVCNAGFMTNNSLRLDNGSFIFLFFSSSVPKK